MRKTVMMGCLVAAAVGVALPAHGNIICSGESDVLMVNTPVPSAVTNEMIIHVAALSDFGESVTVEADGICLFSTTNQTATVYRWQPQTLGEHALTCTFGTNVLTKTLEVVSLDFFVQPAPNPPMEKDNNVSITPTTRNYGVNGGGNAIITAGSGRWTAAVSDPWITLNAESGDVGFPVAYTVSANTNVEQRTGYVYVSGWVHTVTQDGVGGTISPTSATFEHDGGGGSITVTAQKKMTWQARPDVDWLSVTPTSGMGEGSVAYQVAPYNEVATRHGTLTVAGNTFTVFQYGRRMKLEPATTTRNYETHVIPITVNALDITQWSVTPNNGWISIVDAGNGKGGDLVTIAIAENPSYRARTGTVTIGTETFTVTQQGRPTGALDFSIEPEKTTASVNGAYGMVAVIATPDLPWVATSGANWLTIYPATASGAGRANVAYNASPNPTLFERTGTIIVTPEAASGMTAKTQTVVQPAAESSLSLGGYEFEASGGSCSVEVSVADIVQWSVDESIDWITVNGSASRTGPGTVVLQAAANGTVYPRSGTVTIAGKSFSVSQRARGVEVEYESILFGTDGGMESISIHPDGNSEWTAVASDPTWITIFQGVSGTGDGEIMYIVAPYNGDGSARIGWIDVGDKKVFITQRPYELSVSPNGSVVKGNNGAGEFGVSANIGAVWNAIVTEPWITIVSGYDVGTGSGTVRFVCADNNTGRPRVGKIIVAGEEYTITQSARILVHVQAEAGRGGSLTGSGTYDKGEKIVLTAVPDSRYQFVRWTGPVESTDNPLVMEANDLTGIRAEFGPMPIDFTSVRSLLDGVDLAWNTLAWATTYKLFRGKTDDIASATELATFLNGAVDSYRDETGERGVTYQYWVMAIGDDDDVVSMPVSGMRKSIVNSPITYMNLRGSTHTNPDTYVEGREVVFSRPSILVGYTFTGWTPKRIAEDMTGAQEVRAGWTANEYSIVYDANGGSGTTSATPATYGIEAKVAANGFTRVGYSFAGWATNATGAVVFTPEQPVTNLTDAADAVLTFYAVWAVNQYTATFNANGGEGGKSVTQNYGTALVAPTVTRTGYTFKGWSPAVPATVPAGNATYIAQWEINKYTTTLELNGGDGEEQIVVEHGTNIGELPVPTCTGHVFAGWFTAATGGEQVPDDAAITGDMTLYAQWTVNQYMVTFDANGGEGGWSRSMDYGATIDVPTVTRTGYTFTGWSSAVAATVPIGGATYVAQWDVNKYTVTFDMNGGSCGKIVVEGTVWYVNGSLGSDYNSGTSESSAKATIQAAIDASSDGDTILVASGMYAPITTENKAITIRSMAGAASTIIDGQGSKVCVSGGQYNDDRAPVALCTNTIVVGFTLQNGNGRDRQEEPGNGGCASCGTYKNCIILNGENHGGGCGAWAIFENCLIKGGRAPNGGNVIGSIVRNCTVVDGYASNNGGAYFNCAVYNSVCYNNDSAWRWGNDNGTSYTETSWLSTADPCKATGCEQINVFKGDPGFVDVANGDYRLAAESPCIDAGDNSYAIGESDLDNNVRIANGTVDIGCYEYGAMAVRIPIPDMELVYGEELGDLPEPALANHTFDGWWTAKSGGARISATTRVTGDATYYAHWTIDQYMVTFDANGGEGGWSRSMDYGATIDAPTVTRTGYTFTGWSSAVAATVPIGGATYVAQWTKNRYAVTFNANGGAGGKTVTQGYGTALAAPTVSRTGYTFNGWSPSVPATVPAGNATYTAQWKVNQYTVTFNANGGTGGTAVTQDYGTALSAPTVTRTGYTFMGWSPSVPAKVPAGNATYTAQWEINKYTTTLELNGGDGEAQIVVEHGMKVGEIPVPTRTGHTFVGWFTAATDGEQVPDDEAITGDMTLYAQWKVNQYTVTFNANGGTGGTAVMQDYGTALSAPTVTRTGYTFMGWSPSVPAKVPAGNATYVAQWTINQYTVTFDANGGEGGKTATQNYGTTLVAPTVTRTGYTFKGWSPAVPAKIPAGNATYVAQWEINQYTVTFNANGGTGGTSVTQDYGTPLVAPTVTRTGYTFRGWSPAVPAKVPVGNATYVAQWEINKYKATLELNGGDGEGQIVVEHGTKVGEIPVPTRTGHTFAGWFTAATDGEQVPDDEEITGDTTLYAQWTVNQYLVTFDANDGEGGWSEMLDYDSEIVAPTVTRTGYTLRGWAPAVAETVPVDGATYVAQWEINKYTVTFDANGGLMGSANRIKSVTYGGTCGELPTPKRDHYAFLGWFTATDGGDSVTAETAFYDDAMLYAHWRYVELGVDIAPAYETSADGTFALDLKELLLTATMPKMTFKGLPTGLKFDSKTSVISGKATKPGVYKVTVSATNATVKKPVTAEFEIVVPNLRSEVLPNLAQDKDAYGVVMCGVAINPKLVNCKPEGGWTVKVAGLPSGLKYDAKTGKITGVPTKAGTFTVTFTATKKGEEKEVATITLKTEALPTWATGAFAGYVNAGDDYGSATMTVAANGKVSGKIALGGTNWTFSAASFSRVEGLGDARAFVIEAEAKAGKATRPVVLTVGGAVTPLVNAVTEGTFGDGEMKLWRNMWKDKATASEAKAMIEEFVGVYTVSIADGADYGSGYMSLTVGKDGNVKASGKLADGTSVSATSPLMYDEDEGWFAMLYAVPSAYKGGAFAVAVSFGERLAPAMFAPQWTSRNVQATGVYGEGFARYVDLSGAYYNKLDTLRKYYESLRLELDGAPELGFTFKETLQNAQGRKVTTSSAATASAVDTLGQSGLTAKVNDKGAIVVEKATKPVQDKETKEWSYNGVNDGAMTLSFAQATGIFKGSYTFWYDYESAFDATKDKATMSHTSKKVSFEGIFVQGAESMRGFYLWDATGAYDDPKTGKPKTYKYKESHGVTLAP